MKKAISIWSFSGKTVRESMALAKEIGFDGIELALNESGSLSLALTAEELADELAAIKAYAEELGLPIHSLATGLYWKYAFSDNDAAIRQKAAHIAETQIRAAKALGADAVLILPGLVTAAVPYDVAYDRAVAAIRSLAPLAEELKIQVGIENVWNKFMLSPLEMRDFVDRIGSPYVGVYFDVGNVLYNGYPEHWIPILGSRIKKVHFKDYKADAGGFCGFVDLLSGDVNWPAVTKALAAADYDDWVTAEIIPVNKYYPEQTLRGTLASMRQILIS